MRCGGSGVQVRVRVPSFQTGPTFQMTDNVLDAQTQNGDEQVGEYSFSGQSCLSSADSC